MLHEALTEKIIGAAIEVHKNLGPGLLESAYEACLAHELVAMGLSFTRQKPLPLEYKGMVLEAGYRLDLVVEESVLLELKSVEKIEPIHEAQLMTYMRLSGLRVGLLINFNVLALHTGIKRRVR
ncbi:MAG: GxxExxY protein [Phycisphaeraceae bacterium]|nr:MAG: GxxExxY protein [Phycisphaeraceae bacterium]